MAGSADVGPGTASHMDRYPWMYDGEGNYDPEFENRPELGPSPIVTPIELEKDSSWTQPACTCDLCTSQDPLTLGMNPAEPDTYVFRGLEHDISTNKPMSQTEALTHQEQMFADALVIMGAKRHDYSGTVDPFKNLRDSAFVGVEPMRGVLVRIMDKLARLRSFLDEGTLKVQDEAVYDTCLDILNYTAIFAGLAEEEK